jgi:hypothetical protein
MTKEELAAQLNGRTIGQEITDDEAAAAKAAGLVVVFGASDDLMEFRGAIEDEAGAYDGGEAQVDAKGLLPDRGSIDDDDRLEDFFMRRKTAQKIEAHWCKAPPFAWTFSTEIPHATFTIVEDGDPWCQGIVFELPK